MDTKDLRRQLEEARINRERLFAESQNLRARTEADGESDGLAERISNINRGIANADDRISDLEAEYGRAVYIEAQASDSRNFDTGSLVERDERRGERLSEYREQALRTLERHADIIDNDKETVLERLVRSDDPRDLTSRYLAAVGNEHYRSAFGKICADPQHGHLRFTPEEVEGMRAVNAVEAERSLAVGSGAAGGFAIPFELDPSIILSSSGVLNPVRQLARVITIGVGEWRGVSSDGVVATYRAEGATMVDNSPTLVQPSIVARRWDAFIPYSWEVGQDWPSGALQDELVRLVADAQNVNDAAVFYSGTSSSNQPTGLMTSLGTSQQVLTVGTAALAAGDIWSLKAAVPARFLPNSSFAAPSAFLDKVYRLVPNASTSEPALMASRDAAVVGMGQAAWGFNAGTALSSGSTLAICGDFRNYQVVDRLGLSAVPIPALFSGNTAGGIGYPTGQAGLAVWGRTGANCLVPNAFRVLTAR